MASLVRLGRRKVCPFSLRRCFKEDTLALGVRFASDSSSSLQTEDSAETVVLPDEEVCNVSRLSPNHYRQYHGIPPELPYKDSAMRKTLFSKLGLDSGEDPRIMWPSRQNLLDLEQEEKEEAMTLQDRLRTLQEEKMASEKAKLQRRQAIEKNMSQMSKLISDYKKRLQDAEEDVRLRKAKKEALLEEAREYFGYKIQANDPKFEKMVEEKAEEEKKQAKKLKKEEKTQKLAAKLAQEAKLFEQKTAEK